MIYRTAPIISNPIYAASTAFIPTPIYTTDKLCPINIPPRYGNPLPQFFLFS